MVLIIEYQEVLKEWMDVIQREITLWIIIWIIIVIKEFQFITHHNKLIIQQLIQILVLKQHKLYIPVEMVFLVDMNSC